MNIHTFYNNPFQEACYVVSEFAEDPKACILIDCGTYRPAEQERIRKYIAENELRPVAHLLTHGHLDHVFGSRFLYDEYGLLPQLREADAELYCKIEEQAEMFGLPLLDAPLSEYSLLPDMSKDGIIHLLVSDTQIDAIPTPGHTQGGVCYLFPHYGQGPDILFSGDTLFQGGYGRTDLPGGDMSLLMMSLRRLSQLSPSTIVYPGHGYPTTIREEF